MRRRSRGRKGGRWEGEGGKKSKSRRKLGNPLKLRWKQSYKQKAKGERIKQNIKKSENIKM